MAQPVDEDGTQQSVVDQFERGVATHNRTDEEPTFRTGLADGGPRCVEWIELPLLTILRKIVDRIDQMREPTEIRANRLERLTIVPSTRDVGRGREHTGRRLRRRAKQIVEVRRPRFDRGLPRQPREHGVDVEQARHIAVGGGATSQRRGNPSCDQRDAPATAAPARTAVLRRRRRPCPRRASTRPRWPGAVPDHRPRRPRPTSFRAADSGRHASSTASYCTVPQREWAWCTDR